VTVLPFAPDTPPDGSLEVQNGDALQPGDEVDVSGDGFAPESAVDLLFQSELVLFDTVETDAKGVFSATVQIPEDAEEGEHTLFAFGAAPDGRPRLLAAPVMVREVSQLRVSLGESSPSDTTVNPGERDVAALQVRLESLANEDIDILSVTVAGSRAGNGALGMTSVKVYHDRNGDGQVDADDALLGAGEFTSDEGTVTLALRAPFALPAGGVDYLLIAVDVDPSLAGGSLAGAVSLAVLGFLSLSRRGRKGWCLFVVLIISIILMVAAGCRQKGEPVTAAAFRVSLTGIEGEGAHSQVPVGVTGLPLTGAAIRVTGNSGTVGGGIANTASNYTVVPGGSRNEAQGEFSFAAGPHAKARHDGAFMWAEKLRRTSLR
jgi:hypothetical protein